jgi:hypothetical protein
MVEMVVGALLLVLIAVVVFQSIDFRLQREEWVSERKDLMNRIMARNYEVYVNAEVIKDQAKQPSQSAFEEEHGIPVI